MDDQNPYAPPSAPVSDRGDEVGQLAGRGQRFRAAIVDAIIAVVLAIPVMFLLGTLEYLKAGQPLPVPLRVATSGLGFLAYAMVHFYFLRANGQTVGKKVIGIRIVDIDNQVPNVWRILGLRVLPVSITAMVPVLGQLLPLVDVLFIFRKDRRCVHDLIAGTRVVRAK
jgi:uncharacterized RDD family membrane protein YckC